MVLEETVSFRQRPEGYTLFVNDVLSAQPGNNTEAVHSWASLIDSVIGIHVGRSQSELWCIKFMRKFGAQRALRVFKKGIALPFGEGAVAYLGTKPSLESRDAPMAAAQCIEQLNSFAPLQWSNTLEICNVTRFCKKRPREQEQALVNPLEAFVAEQMASLESLYPNILQPTLSLNSGSFTMTDGVSSLLVDDEKAADEAVDVNDDNDNPAETARQNKISAKAADEAVDVNDDNDNPAETARQNKISANLIANAELGIRSLSEVGASSKLQSFPQVLVCSHRLPKATFPTKLALTIPDPRKGADCITRPCVFIRQSIIFYNPDGSEVMASGSGGCSCRYRAGEKELLDLLPSVSHVLAEDLKDKELVSRFSVFGTSAVPAVPPSLPSEEDTGPLPLSQQLSQSGSTTRDVATVKKLRMSGTLKSRAWTEKDMNQGLPIKFTSAEAFRMALLGIDLSTLSTARPIATRAIEKAEEDSRWEDAAKGIFQ